MDSTDNLTDSESFTQIMLWPGPSVVSIRRKKVNQDGYILHSRVLVCPICYERWAGIIIEGEGYALAESVLCQECRNFEHYHDGEVPGSILERGPHLPIDLELLDYLPAPLLAREFHLHISHFFKEPLANEFTTDDKFKYTTRVSAGRDFTIVGSECASRGSHRDGQDLDLRDPK